MRLLHALLTKLPDLFSKSIQHYRSRTAQVAKHWEMGGAAASNEIRREIDQCTLIPINHDSHRAWIIISCAGKCHLWEISRNNFCTQCKGGGKKAVKIYYLDYCLTKVRVLRDCGSTLLASKWIPLVSCIHGSEVLQYPHTVFGCIYH